MSEKFNYHCNVCYCNINLTQVKRGTLLNSCGCFYCGECFRDAKSYNVEKSKCYSCSKQIDYNRAIDITNKESVKKIEFIYEDPENQLKKVIECMKVYIKLFSFKNYIRISI
jgi:hypothetical protein